MYAVMERGENYTKVLSEVCDVNEAVEITKRYIMLYSRDHPNFAVDRNDFDDEEVLAHYCLSDKKDLISHWNDNIANTPVDDEDDVFHPYFYIEVKK